MGKKRGLLFYAPLTMIVLWLMGPVYSNVRPRGLMAMILLVMFVAVFIGMGWVVWLMPTPIAMVLIGMYFIWELLMLVFGMLVCFVVRW